MTRRSELSAGSPALDLVDTVSGRGGNEVELLRTSEDLVSWLSLIGVDVGISPVASYGLADVKALRDAIFRCVSAAVADAALPARDIATINRMAARPAFRPQLIDGSIAYTSDDPVSAAMSLLAADAIEVLTPPLRARLRTCPECNMLFVDKSKPGRRRWCSSSSGCGNRAKVRNFRNRQAAQQGMDDE